MTILINPYSSAGNALRKWEKVRSKIKKLCDSFLLHTIYEREGWESLVRESLQSGERAFVAGGGDGTVNLLLNTLMNNATPRQLSELKIGAIGLGSSNDFHKPFNREISGVPIKIDFNGSQPRDVGCLYYQVDGRRETRYFLINASIGITANANFFFNHPDRILHFLKKHSTSAAITYAACKTIAGHRNISVQIQTDDNHTQCSLLSNLAVIKNPHFSGSLRYGVPARYRSHEFDIFFCHDMTRKNLLRLLASCANGGASRMEKMNHWISKSVAVRSDSAIPVEYDGEVVLTEFCRFSILPICIGVCP